MFLISPCSCPCSIHWSQVLSRKWRYSWSSADGQCSNYIWVIDNFIVYLFCCLLRCHLYLSVIQGALDISRSFFFEELGKDTPYLAHEGEVWRVIRECKAWPKLYHCNCYAVPSIVLYIIAIYRKSIYLMFNKGQWFILRNICHD